MRSRHETRITAAEFRGWVAPLEGLAVSRAWRGHGTALFLELGALHEVPLLRGGTSLKGAATVMIEWSWRVERPRSIAFGSWSTDRRMDFGVARLQGRRVAGVTVEGRLPELVMALSGGVWVHAFSTVEGQPRWTVFLPDGSWLTVAGGLLVRNTQNAR